MLPKLSQELHVIADEVQKTKRELRALGYNCHINPAVHTSKGGGTSGGTAVLCKRHYTCSWNTEAWKQLPELEGRISAVYVGAGPTKGVYVVSVYLHPGEGWSDMNRIIMNEALN